MIPSLHIDIINSARIDGSKEFYTFNLKGHNNSSRMLDFLSTIGLQDRMNSEDIIDNPIDWKKISSNLLLKLKQSKEFLNQIR